MRVHQSLWRPGAGWSDADGVPSTLDPLPAQLVLVFGSTEAMQREEPFAQLRACCPGALIAGCSTAGEILGTTVHDDTLVASAIRFERSRVRAACLPISDSADSAAIAAALAMALVEPDLRHVLVLCDGLSVNGTAFARALRDTLPAGVEATGGLAADADRFRQTVVALDGVGRPHQALAIGFYGESLHVGYGSLGGWDCFGPSRLITRSVDNVLYELDGAPALDLYRSYLGDDAADLPAAGLRFPLALEDPDGRTSLVRTVLAIDEAAGSMTFAGHMPQGMQARLMRANFDRLVEGASGAATAGCGGLGGVPPEFAILVSCVGRKLVLRQRVEQETEAVREVLGPQAAMSGFYSYGEICPQGEVGRCELHNQTMTITTFAEA
jgi:hypothetical protein